MLSRSLLLIPLMILSSCCWKIGPTLLQKDSLAYNQAFSGGRDQQLLMNIVKLKYRDAPTFLKIGIISTSYSLERSVTAGPILGDFESRPLKLVGVTGPDFTGTLSEDPQFTYEPVRSYELVQEMLTPVPIATIANLNASGWAIDRIFKICVQKMNNIPNAPSASGPTPTDAPIFKDFTQVVTILREFQKQHALLLTTQIDQGSGEVALLMKVDREMVDKDKLATAWKLLEVDPDIDVLRIVPHTGIEREPSDLLLDTRNPMGILHYFSQAVETPLDDEERGLVTVTEDEYGTGRFDWDQLLGGIMKIQSCCPDEGEEPAAVSVNYRGKTFYIADNDLQSKSTFSLFFRILNLQHTQKDEGETQYNFSLGG